MRNSFDIENNKNFVDSPSSSYHYNCEEIPRLVSSSASSEDDCDDQEGNKFNGEDDDEEVVILFNKEDDQEDNDRENPSSSSWDFWAEQSDSIEFEPTVTGARITSAKGQALPPGCTVDELNQVVTFVTSRKDPKTGDFIQERKSTLWCLRHGCEELLPRLWSNYWYFTFLYGEEEGKRVWLDTQNRRLVKQSNGKAIKVDRDDFDQMLTYKEKGNRDFNRCQYNSALENYIIAEQIIGGDVMGLYLVKEQRAELVNVLSNQAECYLRMKKYTEAIMKSTAAIKLDSRHEKSILRRAKALVYGASDGLCFDPLGPLNIILEDFKKIVEMNGHGAKELGQLLDVFKAANSI